MKDEPVHTILYGVLLLPLKIVTLGLGLEINLISYKLQKVESYQCIHTPTQDRAEETTPAPIWFPPLANPSSTHGVIITPNKAA